MFKNIEKEIIHSAEDFKFKLLKKGDKKGSLIPLLQSAQDTYGYIPETAIYCISEIVGIPASEIYGVITFYSQFRLKPTGKYLIKICEGTACHVNGAKKILKSLQDELGITIEETTEDGLFTLQSVSCLGCCSLSPVIMVNDDTYGSLKPEKIKGIINKYKASNKHLMSVTD